MPLRFWRRVRIAPGLRVNLSKSGASVSIGRRGAWYTIGPRGQRMTVGAPGTGLFWTEHSGAPQPGRAARVAGMIVIAAIWALFTIAMWWLVIHS